MSRRNLCPICGSRAYSSFCPECGANSKDWSMFEFTEKSKAAS